LHGASGKLRVRSGELTHFNLFVGSFNRTSHPRTCTTSGNAPLAQSRRTQESFMRNGRKRGRKTRSSRRGSGWPLVDMFVMIPLGLCDLFLE